MPTHDYKLRDGSRVPGTTTIISRFKESGGLIHWAWDLGKQGIDYRQARDSACTAGTLSHEMIERKLHKEDPYSVQGPPEQLELARMGFKAFEEWASYTRLEILATEVSLVSEAYRYGGTLDAMGIAVGKLALLDWKTSNRIYADYLIQIAAYANLWEENNPKDKIESFHLLRFGKEDGSFHHHSWPRPIVTKGWVAFTQMRSLYDVDRELKKAVG